MSTKQIHGGGQPDGDDAEATAGQVQANFSTQGVDDILDDIDDLLETNAEEFVRSFVQKGGQ
ncbi:ubiquitin-like protein Pup [Corynebacterium argentoratense]|uniref:ubiquitin-like protein Pup n=1 Tax=Corynebacterium argentoratense TaxID=42817 RepID=UPI001F331FF0|nr:ubiquitin-like protein Pup [Corynebacterium argentoratense]MCF1764659.1 ubiquitin-like protein Pup [Corynebacterium argentoratense]